MIEKAKNLARHTEQLCAGNDWGVDDQDTLEWLISQAEEAVRLKARERACPTMLEAEARCLVRALQEIADAVGLSVESSPSQIVEAIKLLATQREQENII